MTRAEADRRQRRYARRRKRWRELNPPKEAWLPIAEPGPLAVDDLVAE